jgi:hypothetical protein
MKWLLFLFPLSLSSQVITLTPIGNQDVSNIPVTVEHFVTTGTGVVSTKIFRTHYGTGNTSTYPTFAFNASDLDKMTNSSYPGTTLYWQGNLPASSVFYFNWGGTLVNAGASLPPGYDYYSVEATCIFVPKETGTYSFRLTSDDGADLFINGVNVLNYYGGHGMNPYYYANYSMVAGQQYSLRARMQEFGGGDGLYVEWKRPTQSNWSVQSDEIGIKSSAWIDQGTKYTNQFGITSWANSSNRPYRVTVDVTGLNHTLQEEDLLYMLEKKAHPSELQSWDFYTCDCDNSTSFDINDIIFCYTILTNRYQHNNYVFTSGEKLDIETNPGINYYTIYFPKQKIVIENQNQFFIMGTGKHRTLTLMQKMQ